MQVEKISSLDLALASARKRQSEKTGFVHLFPEEQRTDTIPIYENFCFAFALLRQKTIESVNEAKKLFEKLLAFQTIDGNFPIYLHEYPHCYQRHMALKIAPILLYSLRLFGSFLGESLKTAIQNSLHKALIKPSESLFWENRRLACLGDPLFPLDSSGFSSIEWTDWIITQQIAGVNHFSIPYDDSLQLFLGPQKFDVQEKAEPRPNPIEWLLAEGHFSERLLQDHPHQIWCAPLFPLSYTQSIVEPFALRLFWKGKKLHSLVGQGLTFDLTEEIEMGKTDLFEAVLYADIETRIWVQEKKATTFKLGDWITVQTPEKTIQIQFQLTKGQGDFCGHVFPSNRPSQICKGFQAFDWKIGLRTLRRTPFAQISITIQ